MIKLLLIGEESRTKAFRGNIQNSDGFEIDLSDGDEEEDFEEYDVIVDLNLDDDDENMPIYAGLRDKIVIVSSTKQSLAESIYSAGVKVKCKLFGINAMTYYLQDRKWEISAYRFNEYESLAPVISLLQANVLQVSDRVGMLRPRIDFVRFNELSFCIQEQIASSQDLEKFLSDNPMEMIDQIGITDVFENLMAMYEDTKEGRYKPSPLLKTKYLRNQKFIKK